MEGYPSRSTEAETVYYRAGLAALLMALGVGAWLVFANRLAEADESMWLGVWLGISVILTVCSAAVALLAVMTAHHQEQMRALITRSNA